MKRFTCPSLMAGVLLALAGGLIAVPAVHAAVSGVNTPVTSAASITFDDTFSSAPPLGITFTGPSVSPWNGSLVSLPTTTDPNTADFASGDISASFAGNTYAINLANVTLNQAVLNTGTAHLTFAFNIEFQLDGAGLPLQPTLFPNFVVNGTVQNIAGSFAAVTGFIDYYGVNTAGTYSVLETVNYNSIWTTPGNFTGTAAGVPVSGTTPLLVANTTLTLNGVINFQVDPASINAYSVMVPEPVSLAVLAIAAAMAVLRPVRPHRCQP
ncbi:MAG: hypothetical protein IT441_06405 [Phycisphaeraceae bacterium]|nr:hypothetical protein [Phycisphaeraceae bacterium]